MNQTYAKYFEVWFETYRKPRVREVTARKYMALIDLLEKDELGKKELRKITRKDVQKFFNSYGRSRRRNTVLDTKMYINASFADAYHDGFLNSNPCARVDVVSIEDTWTVQELKEVREKKKWLEFDEYKKLKMYLMGLLHVGLKQCINTPLFIKNNKQEVVHRFNSRGWPPQMILTVIYIALKTGARFSEIVGLTKKDIDFNERFLNIDKTWDYKYNREFAPTKNIPSIRQIPIDQEFLMVMQQYLGWLKAHDVEVDSGAILVRNKANIFNSTVNNTLKAIFVAIDMEPLTLHKLRHTQASILIAQNISLQVIAKRLGHNDTTMIQKTYGHLLESTEAEENQKILELI